MWLGPPVETPDCGCSKRTSVWGVWMPLNNRVLRVTFLVLGMILLANQAGASPLTWEVVGVTFHDGGTASGHSDFDADTDEFSNINVIQTELPVDCFP
jgi:hypothetical protein